MDFETMYGFLGEFRMEGNIPMGKLAEAARMEDYVLRECIAGNTKLMLGTFATLANGMLKVMEGYDEELKAELQKHYANFINAYIKTHEDQFDGSVNHYFKQTILRLIDAAGSPELSDEARELFDGKKAPDTSEAVKEISALLASLNETGLSEAVKRVRELTFVPDYKLQ